MVTPPSSLPSPSPSNSSSHHQSFSSMSQMYPPQPARAPSSASHLSGASGQSYLSNGSNHHDEPSPPFSPSYADTPNNQQTPQPHPMTSNKTQYTGSNPSAFLPPLTSSPPPHAPPYIPPPQHAMAPDPIHSMQMAMMPPPMSPSSMMPWNGPSNGWRSSGPTQPGYTTAFRQSLPNGHGLAGPPSLPLNPHEPYQRAAASGTLNPLQQAMMGNGRPGSAHGEARRRRDRDEEGDRDAREEEVISTIFVVGFPDDMLEREFQNIFTFAPGFEAATLKFPSGSRTREPTAALLAELQRLEASQAQMLEHGEIHPGLEEQIAALQLVGTSSSSSTTTPSAAMSLTPSAPSGATFGSTALPQMPTRRQTIGFARFRTRADAMAAKEQLQGRKIDSLTGATLKAEMAKKNLHTKRATSGEELVGLLLRSGRLANLMGTAQNTPIQGQPGGMAMGLPGYAGQQPSAREVWDSWPGQSQAPSSGIEREPATSQPGFSSSLGFSDRSFVPPQSAPSGNQPHPASTQSNASTSPPLSVTSPNQRPTDSKALLALAEEADALEGWNIGSMGIGLDNGYRSQSQVPGERQRERSGGSQSGQGIHMQAPQALSGSLGRGTDVNFGSSPPGGSDHLSDGGRGLGNPADQNPPINTLYVGNLPAISPPTHPPNFLEESLRALFSRCLGFKRMSFRQKINGPMCFVEFEDVGFATQAIGQLYGHNLGGLVKGGIRLSYSKNSLGQRGSSHPTGISTSMFGGIAHTVALAGMSPPSANSQPSAPNYSHGLQLQSAPVPQAPDLRRGSEATGLSPTAQPFNATLPMATSPRSRYFGTSPSQDVSAPTFGSFNPGPAVPTAINTNNPNPPGSMSPVASPIRTPASYSWVSTSGGGQGGVGNGYGFEGFSSSGGLPSLDGAASAWGAGQAGNSH